MRRLVPPLLVLVGALGPSLQASAQYGPREPLLSERAFGLAGAVTGSAAGPSAAYYNPGGLADTPGTAVGASLSLRTFRSYTLQDGYTSVLGVEDLTDSGLLSVPIFVGAVLKFGDRDATNMHQHALAAGMLIRSSLDREFLADDFVEDDGGSVTASLLEIQENVERRWFYASYAFRLSNEFSVGATAAVSVFDREYREVWSQATDLEGPAGDLEGGLSTRNARVDLSATSLLFRIGASWRPSDWVQISATVQLPGIELFDSGRAFFERVTACRGLEPRDCPTPSGMESGFFRVDDDELDVNATIPWELRLGAYARFDSRFGMGLDLGLTGSQGSPNDPVHPLGREIPMDGDRPAATYFADRYWTDVTFDAAVGAEIGITDEVPLRLGTSFELSGLPTAVGDRDTYVPDRVDRLTVTAAVGVQGDRYDFGLGVGYTYGFGTGFRPVDPFGGGYAVTDVQSHEITFFVSGVTGAATQLALDTYRAITGSSFDDDADVPDDSLENVEELRTEPEREQEREDARRERDLDDLPEWILESLEEDADEPDREGADDAAAEAVEAVVEEASAEGEDEGEEAGEDETVDEGEGAGGEQGAADGGEGAADDAP